MIKPPLNTPSFYAAVFEKPAAKFVIGLVAKSFAQNDDIDQVMVTSLDFKSDIEATIELQNSTKEVASHLVDDEISIDTALKFNPLFLPNTNDLHDVVELDEQGEVIAVDGFKNPYSVMTLKLSIDENPNLIEGKVVYKQFELPSITEALEPIKEGALS